MLNYLFIFGLSYCDIRDERPVCRKCAIFGDTFKVLTISDLNFVDA